MESSLRPLAPWTPGPFRFAARLLMLVMLFQGAIFFMPVQTQAQVGPCEETFYPLADSLGSVNTLTDSTGSVVLTQHFLPFGEDFETPKPPVTNCNNGDPWPYGFTGQYHDQETSLIYFHARYYNPAIGHFMSPDSVIPNPNDSYSYDRYAYCRNNPVNLTDPSGHFWGALLWASLKIAAVVAAATFAATIVSGGDAGQALQSAGIAFGATFIFGAYAGPIVSAGIEASMHGGNVLQAMLIAGASMAIGVGVGKAVGASVANASSAMQGFMNVLSSGIVGGAISSAMGGDFWQGFTGAAVAAGVSLAANEVAGEIDEAADNAQTAGGGNRNGLPPAKKQLNGSPGVPKKVEQAAKQLEQTAAGTAKDGMNEKGESDTRYLESSQVAIVLKDGTTVLTCPREGNYVWTTNRRGESNFDTASAEIKVRVPNPRDIDLVYLMHPHVDPKGNVISWSEDVQVSPKQFLRQLNETYGQRNAVGLDQIRVLVPNWQGGSTVAIPATGKYYYYTPGP